jgi:hypothetical protein
MCLEDIHIYEYVAPPKYQVWWWIHWHMTKNLVNCWHISMVLWNVTAYCSICKRRLYWILWQITNILGRHNTGPKAHSTLILRDPRAQHIPRPSQQHLITSFVVSENRTLPGTTSSRRNASTWQWKLIATLHAHNDIPRFYETCCFMTMFTKHRYRNSHQPVTWVHISETTSLTSTLILYADCGGAVGWDTALQAGKSRVRFSMVSLGHHLFNPSGRTLALGLIQPLTEMNTRNISWR